MQLTRTARRIIATGAVAGGTLGGLGVTMATASPASADTLPAYTANGFCSTTVANAGTPTLYKKVCTGQYKVTKATYQFTQDQLGVCPAMGVMVNLTEVWISPPTGGSPTILNSYKASL